MWANPLPVLLELRSCCNSFLFSLLTAHAGSLERLCCCRLDGYRRSCRNVTRPIFCSARFCLSYSIMFEPLPHKAVMVNLFRGRGFSRPFCPFPSFLFSFPSFFFALFSPPQSGPLNPAKGFGGALLAFSGGEHPPVTFPRLYIHQKYPAANAFLVYLEPRERV